MSVAVATTPAPPPALRIHVALPEKVTGKTLYRWVKGMRRDYKLSQTALALLETLIDKCRGSDFELGSLCGVWESPSRLRTTYDIDSPPAPRGVSWPYRPQNRLAGESAGAIPYP